MDVKFNVKCLLIHNLKVGYLLTWLLSFTLVELPCESYMLFIRLTDLFAILVLEVEGVALLLLELALPSKLFLEAL